MLSGSRSRTYSRHAFAASLGRQVSAVFLLACIGNGAASDFCYNGPTPCRATLEEAEADMRAADAAVGPLLELKHTELLSYNGLRFNYHIKPQPALPLYAPSYLVGTGSGGLSGGYGCAPTADPNLAGWCVTEAAVVDKVMGRYRELVSPSCVFSAPELTGNRVEPYESVTTPVFGTHGFVNYGLATYSTSLACDGSSGTFTFTVEKRASFQCPSGYSRLTDSTPNNGIGDLALPALCSKSNPAQINGVARQVASCPANDKPCHPATGDKARAETDFFFAGRPFTRHYHSLRQFRNNSGFAVGWTHTYSDRLSLSLPGLVDDQGYYEVYTSIGTDRYAGQRSMDRILEKVTDAGAVRARLRLPDGEVREFDSKGLLLAVRHPSDPRNDVTLTYADYGVSSSYREGVPLTATDGQGRVLRFIYGSNGLLSQVVLPDGQTIGYGYDTDRNLTSVDYGNGQVKQYHYAESGKIGHARQKNHLTGITAETGNRFANFSYDAQGRVIDSTALGTPNETTTVVYDSATQASVTTALNQSKVYTMQSGVYRLITEVDLGGGVDDLNQYDANGRLERSIDRRNVETAYTYEHTTGNEVASITYADGTPEERREEFDRNTANHVTEQRTYDDANTLVAKTVWNYNGRNQLSTVTAVDPANSANNRTTTTTYCESGDVASSNSTCPILGLVKSIDGPRSVSDITSYEYRSADEAGCAAVPMTSCLYRKGDLWKATTATGQVTEVMAYDRAGRVTSVKDPNGVITDLVYSHRGWLVASKVRGTNNASEADDRITLIEYTDNGLVDTVLQPDGALLSFTYDHAHRLLRIEDGLGNSIHYTLNAVGQRIKEETLDSSEVLRRTLARTYDTLGRLDKIRDNLAQQSGNPATLDYAYDNEGNVSGTEDALGRDTSNVYDPLGRLKSAIADAGGADESITGFTYDALDRLKIVEDPNGLDTLYDYNAFGERTQVISPDTGTSNFTHDKAGNLATSVDDNGMDVIYDNGNRLTSVDYEGTDLDESYSYDVAEADCEAGETFLQGRLAKVEDGSGSTTWCYNRFGDLVRKVQRGNYKTFVLRWVYQSNGQLASMVYPDGTFLYYNYDLQGRVLSIIRSPDNNFDETVLSSVQYAPFGPVQSWTFGNGLQHRRSVNLDYRPGFIEDGPEGTPGPGLNLGYEFDAVGNLQTLNAADQFTVKRQYTHDRQDRLTKVEGASLVDLQTYVYDDTGNRTSFNDGTVQAYAYTSGTHHLASVASVPRAYDDVGNLETIGSPATRTFTYNAANRMDSATSGGTTATYRYNAMGQRVRKTVSSTDRYSVHDEAGRWIGDYDHSGNAIQQVVWLGDLPVSLLVDSGWGQKSYYIEADALGTPRVVIDPSRGLVGAGTVVWRWDMEGEAFGAGLPNQDPDGDSTNFVFDMRFSGQRYDAHTGFNYNYFRDYDPSVGRYVQSDPIGLDGGISTYSYVGGNPLESVDPFGLRKVILVNPADDPNIYFGALVDQNNFWECTVYAHGAWTHITDSRLGNSPGQKVRYYANDPRSMQRLNMILKFNGCTEDQPVVLKSCNTGAEPDKGKLNLMEALAKMRGASVTAPNQSVWYGIRGPMQTPYGHMRNDIHGPINRLAPGRYITVKP
ncbi:MAG: RHS repeat-associated core domain-containing protein [Pseudomonadota bacterium]